jgi:hypothetical protein
MTTSALKGNGFTAYLPDMGAFATALAQVQGDHGGQWTLHVQDEALVASLQGLGLRTTSETPVYYAFIGF